MCMCSDLLETGGMYCRNGGYVSVAEMRVCCRNGGYVLYIEMGGMYQLQKWGVCISCRYVLWKYGVCISCRNGGMSCRNGGMYQLQKWGV